MELPFWTYTELKLMGEWLNWYAFALDCGYCEWDARKAATRQMRLIYKPTELSPCAES